MWGATILYGYGVSASMKFQSTLPVWGATRTRCASHSQSMYFNPRSPCGERLTVGRKNGKRKKFQSTLPVWGATVRKFCSQCTGRNFNPRSPCGERRPGLWWSYLHVCISIHAPRVGSDICSVKRCRFASLFQSTLPVWGATFTVSFVVFWGLFQSTLPVWGAT